MTALVSSFASGSTAGHGSGRSSRGSGSRAAPAAVPAVSPTSSSRRMSYASDDTRSWASEWRNGTELPVQTSNGGTRSSQHRPQQEQQQPRHRPSARPAASIPTANARQLDGRSSTTARGVDDDVDDDVGPPDLNRFRMLAARKSRPAFTAPGWSHGDVGVSSHAGVMGTRSTGFSAPTPAAAALSTPTIVDRSSHRGPCLPAHAPPLTNACLCRT
jgi:hypothetical protein